MVYAIERILIMFSEPGFSRAALVVDPAVGVFDVIALDAEGGGVGVGEGEGAGVGHVVARHRRMWRSVAGSLPWLTSL